MMTVQFTQGFNSCSARCAIGVHDQEHVSMVVLNILVIFRQNNIGCCKLLIYMKTKNKSSSSECCGLGKFSLFFSYARERVLMAL